MIDWHDRPSPDAPEPLDLADIYLVAVIKGCERYVVSFRPTTRSQAIQQLAAWAQCKSLSFTWSDATAMRQRIIERCPL